MLCVVRRAGYDFNTKLYKCFYRFGNSYILQYVSEIMQQTNRAYNIVINAQAGTVYRLGSEALKEIITKSGLAVKSLQILSPKDFFKEIKEQASQDTPLLVGGGDGTIKSAAEILMQHNKPFGILPLGTMNLLAKDLEIPFEFEQAVNAYAGDTKDIKMDVGVVNDHFFLCCVGIGTMPETSEFREDNRQQYGAILLPRLTIFVLNQMDRLNHRTLKMTFDKKNKAIKTAALVISNNLYQPPDTLEDNNFIRPSLQDGKLGIYSAAPATLWDRVRLMFKLGFGNWRADPKMKEWSAQKLSLETDRQTELISLDGETHTLQTPLIFTVQPKALNLIIPV